MEVLAGIFMMTLVVLFILWHVLGMLRNNAVFKFRKGIVFAISDAANHDIWVRKDYAGWTQRYDTFREGPSYEDMCRLWPYKKLTVENYYADDWFLHPKTKRTFNLPEDLEEWMKDNV